MTTTDEYISKSPITLGGMLCIAAIAASGIPRILPITVLVIFSLGTILIIIGLFQLQNKTTSKNTKNIPIIKKEE